jgi:hypothetical protein
LVTGEQSREPHSSAFFSFPKERRKKKTTMHPRKGK